MRILAPSILGASCAALVLGLTGCGSDHSTDPVPQPAVVDTLDTSTPQAAVAALESFYESQRPGRYMELLSGDFRFHFSANSDPNLVVRYGDNWTAIDDSVSFRHLCDGFTDDDTGDYRAGATDIDFTFQGVNVFPDTSHAGDERYKLVDVAVVTGAIGIPDPSSSDGLQYYSLVTKQAFLVVRGDVAELRPGQLAVPYRWYVRAWNDLTQPVYATSPPGIEIPLPASTTSWGTIKAHYR